MSAQPAITLSSKPLSLFFCRARSCNMKLELYQSEVGVLKEIKEDFHSSLKASAASLSVISTLISVLSEDGGFAIPNSNLNELSWAIGFLSQLMDGIDDQTQEIEFWLNNADIIDEE